MVFYTDGSCSNNGNFPNKGGFSVVYVDETTGEIVKQYHKSCENTTNNREELKAILYVFFNYGKQNPIVYSDSAYCINTLSNWIHSWAKNGWVKSNKKPPENLDLLKPFYDYYNKGYRIQFQKVAGHSGNKFNELADTLAKQY